MLPDGLRHHRQMIFRQQQPLFGCPLKRDVFLCLPLPRIHAVVGTTPISTWQPVSTYVAHIELLSQYVIFQSGLNF